MLMNLLERSNEYNCKECCYNIGCDSFQNRYPCGQWNCWVTVHCDRAEELEDEE